MTVVLLCNGISLCCSCSYVLSRFRLYTDAHNIEMTTGVGPIDISDGNGKEVIVKMVSTLESGTNVFTDSHGLEFAKRTLGTFSNQFIVDNPISGNYYPISMAGYITCAHLAGFC